MKQKKSKLHKPMKRNGVALILVLTFVICVVSLATAMFYFRKEVKQQNVSNVNFLQANFLAQAGVQHALLKCRILPQEAYDSGMVLRGFCPLQAVIADSNVTPGTTRTPKAMQIFISDCNTASMPWHDGLKNYLSSVGLNADDFKYEVSSMSVIAAFTKISNAGTSTSVQFVLTSQILASGTVIEHRGGRGPRSEIMVKTIELTRKIN